LFGQHRHAGSNINPLPELRIGETVLMRTLPGERAGELEYGGEIAAPFGFACPHVVRPAEAADVKRAMADLRRLVPADGKGSLPRDEAERLMKSDAYPLWALGAALLANEG